MNHPNVWILEPGGMRNAFTSGVLDILAQKLTPPKAIYAISSAAHLAIMYLSGTLGHAKHLWVNELTQPKYCSFTNLWLSKTVLDTTAVTDLTMRHTNPQAVAESHTELWIGIVNAATGEERFVKVNQDNLYALLQATISLVPLTRPASFEGEEWADLGITNPIPLKHILLQEADSSTKFLFFGNRPAGFQEKNLPTVFTSLFGRHHGLRNGYLDRARKHQQAQRILYDTCNSHTIQTITPPFHLPCKREERNPSHVLEAYNLGRAIGEKNSHRFF